MINKLEVCIPLAGNINKDAELKRIIKEITKLEKDISLLNKKLANEKFTSKAPAEVVNAEKNKLLQAKENFDNLEKQKNELLSI